MGVFSRLAQLIKSNLNDLISKSEDPEKMLNQVVLDMNNQLVEAKKQVAASIADEKRLAKQLDQEAANATEWERRAMMAQQDRQLLMILDIQQPILMILIFLKPQQRQAFLT